MVGGIEADGREIAEHANVLAAVGRAQRVAAILDHIQLVLFGDCGDRGEVKRISQSVREHDRARLGPDGGGESVDIYVGRLDIDIYENRNAAVLDDGRNRGRKSGGDGDDLASFHDAPFVQFPRCERRKGQKVGGRARNGEPAMRQAKSHGERGLELAGVAAGGQPHVKRGVEKIAQVARIENLSGAGDVGLSRNELFAGLTLGEEFFAERQNLLAQRV